MKKLFYYFTVSKLLNYITNKLLFYKLSIENVCYILHDKILIVITMYQKLLAEYYFTKVHKIMYEKWCNN